jgi:16S rRNA (adenine1518-N6/adenine1519-N6)-dimethyltransferase
VRSSVVELLPRVAPLAPADPRDLRTVLAAAFGQRRKMLRVALRQLVADPEALLTAANIPATARAETLDVDAFCRLARAYAPLRSSSTNSRRPV